MSPWSSTLSKWFMSHWRHGRLPPHGDAEVNKVERVVHNPVDLMVEVPRPVVIEKTIEVRWGVV